MSAAGFDFGGKKALVFGGTKGIGWATSKALAGKGAPVANLRARFGVGRIIVRAASSPCQLLAHVRR